MNLPILHRTMALLVLALVAGQGGCCCFDCIPYTHHTAPLKYIPPISAVTPRNPPCSYVDPMCYGYHATCWRPWPAHCIPDCVEWYQHDAIGPGKEVIPPLAPMPPVPDQPQAPEPASYDPSAVEARSEPYPMLDADAAIQDMPVTSVDVEVVSLRTNAEPEEAQLEVREAPARSKEAQAPSDRVETAMAQRQTIYEPLPEPEEVPAEVKTQTPAEPAPVVSLAPHVEASGYATLSPIIKVRDVPIREPASTEPAKQHSSRRRYQQRPADEQSP